MIQNVSMNKSEWTRELRKSFSGKEILFPEDLAQLVGTNHHVVKCLRAGMSIPLPTIKEGRRWGITLSDVAEWMASRKCSTASPTLANKRLQSPARQRASLGRSLLELKSQSEALQAHLDYLEELIGEVSLLEHLASSHFEELAIAESLHKRPSPKKRPRSNK